MYQVKESRLSNSIRAEVQNMASIFEDDARSELSLSESKESFDFDAEICQLRPVAKLYVPFPVHNC